MTNNGSSLRGPRVESPREDAAHVVASSAALIIICSVALITLVAAPTVSPFVALLAIAVGVVRLNRGFGSRGVNLAVVIGMAILFAIVYLPVLVMLLN